MKQLIKDLWKELDSDDKSFTLYLVGLGTVFFVLPMICGTIILLVHMILVGVSNATGS